MAQELAGNNPNDFLFDQCKRTDRSGGRIAESNFEFFNRSAWRSVEIAKNKFESWFANIPPEKKADLRGRFRGDDRQHSSALLELMTHEILRAIASEVQVEPDLNGGRPDFSAVYLGTRFIAECTIAQESDTKFGALQRERVVLDAIDAVDAGPFTLMVRPISVGDAQPSGSNLRKILESWLATVDPAAPPSDRNTLSIASKVWEWQGWKLHFEAIPFNSKLDAGAIGITMVRFQRVTDGSTISRSLAKKAERYRNPRLPYLIVVAQRQSLGEPEVILDALIGEERWLINGFGVSTQPREFNGFWGSPSYPKNRHVSAVLYKRSLSNAWDICRETFSIVGEYSWQSVPDWYLMHNPSAEIPLPQGMLPFAVECVWRHGKLERIPPANTLNEVLGLPNPWPGEEH